MSIFQKILDRILYLLVSFSTLLWIFITFGIFGKSGLPTNNIVALINVNMVVSFVVVGIIITRLIVSGVKNA